MKNDKKTLKMLSVFAKFTSNSVHRQELQQVNITATGIEASDTYSLLRLNEPQDNPKPIEGFPDTRPIFDGIETAKSVVVTLDPKFVIKMMQAFNALEKNKGVRIRVPLDGRSPVKFSADASNLIGVIMPMIN